MKFKDNYLSYVLVYGALGPLNGVNPFGER